MGIVYHLISSVLWKTIEAHRSIHCQNVEAFQGPLFFCFHYIAVKQRL